MKTKNYLLLLITFILTMGCDDKKNGIVNIRIKDMYEFKNRIVTCPVVLEDNKKGILRVAFVISRKEIKKDDVREIDEVVIYDLDGKQYNSKKIEFIDEPAIIPGKSIEAIDRNGDGVDEILVYDTYGRGWVFEQNGNAVKGYGIKDGLDHAGILVSLNQFEVSINNEKTKKIVTTMLGMGGEYDKKYFLDIRTPGKDSLSGYPIIYGDDEEISKSILADENIYIQLSSRDGDFINGYSINGGKRLAGFPIALSGLNYDVVDMCIYKGEDIVLSARKNSIYRINLKSRKLDKVEIKGSNSVENVKTGYVNGDEYIYAFDNKDNIIYRIDNKNKVIDKLKVKVEDSFDLKYFNTFSINNGNETYIFLIYGEQSLMDIEKMFDKYAPAGEKKKIEKEIEERIYRGHKNYYRTSKLNIEQMKEAKEAIIDSKDGYLREHLGDEYEGIRVLTPRTKVIVYKNIKDRIEQISFDEIPEYELKTFLGDFPYLYPSIYFNSKLSTLAFIVPINKKPEDEKNEKSIIKSYIFSDIK